MNFNKRVIAVVLLAMVIVVGLLFSSCSSQEKQNEKSAIVLPKDKVKQSDKIVGLDNQSTKIRIDEKNLLVPPTQHKVIGLDNVSIDESAQKDNGKSSVQGMTGIKIE